MDQMNLETSPGIAPYKLAPSSGTKDQYQFEQGRNQNSVLMIEESIDKASKHGRYQSNKKSDASTVFQP